MTDVDLIIAGGGPAGLCASIWAARAGMKVLVVEPRRGIIDKACGEGLMPGGVEELHALGIEPPGVPILGVRYNDSADSAMFALGRFPHGHGLGVRRTVLHEALKAKAESLMVRFHEGVIADFEQSRDHVSVDAGYRAQWLIGADGLHSKIRRRLGVGRSSHRIPRFGLRRHYAVPPWSPYVEVYFAEGAEAYVTPVGADRVGVAVLYRSGPGPTGAALGSRFDSWMDRFPLLSARLTSSRARGVTQVRGAGPFEQRVSRRVVGRVLLVGDAAGYVDPLTGEGVALAFVTARAAVDSLLADAPESYETAYRALTARYVVATSMLLAMTRYRALHAPFIYAAGRMPYVFDAILGAVSRLNRSSPSEHVDPVSVAFRSDPGRRQISLKSRLDGARSHEAAPIRPFALAPDRAHRVGR